MNSKAPKSLKTPFQSASDFFKVATGGQDVIKGPMVSWYVQLFPVPACYTHDTAVSGFEGYFVGVWTVK